MDPAGLFGRGRALLELWESESDLGRGVDVLPRQDAERKPGVLICLEKLRCRSGCVRSALVGEWWRGRQTSNIVR
jgi:hypothetical protein